ncbi:MAG TPA: hypothetical protein ENI52_04485 [Thermoplasmata archaeon]|nr:hypothetical protein [Thermoplasmata archaeon]
MKDKGIIKNNIIEFASDYSYFHIDDLRKFLMLQDIEFSQSNLKSYLYYLKQKKMLYSAGRGWYSKLNFKFSLNKIPLKNIISIIKNKFPELDFWGWSTEQIKDFFLHVPFRFLIFLYTREEFMQYMKDLLIEREYIVYTNPSKKEAEKFVSIKEKTVIIRPLVRIRQRVSHFASIEKILIDFCFEIKKINLIDMEEYKHILTEILTHYLINIANMMDYAHERKIKEKIVSILQEVNIIPMRHFLKKPQK